MTEPKSAEPSNDLPTEKGAPEHVRTEIYKTRVSLVIAIIGVIGSLGVALITSRASVKSDLEQRFGNLRPIDVQSGHVEGSPAAFKDWGLDKPPVLTKDAPILPRKYKHQVLFKREFSSPPIVIVGINLLDCSNRANTRIQLYTDNVNSKGFTLVFQTWKDSLIYDVEVDWIAYQQ